MIITCNECNTPFNLNESLLKQTGSKVRCSKCKNVFLAYPSSLSDEPDKSSEVMPETEVEAAIPDEEIEFGEQYKVEEADIEPKGIDLSDIDISLEIDEDLKAEKEPEELGLEFDLDLEPGTDAISAETEAGSEAEIDVKADYGISAEEGLEDIEPITDETFEKDTKVENEPEEPYLELALDLEPGTDAIPAETEAELEAEIDVITKDKEAETKIEESKTEEIDEDVIPEEDVAEKTEDEEKASKAFNLGTISDEQEAEKSTAIADKVEEGIIANESQPKVAAKTRISMPVLLLLLATLLISGAYGTYKLKLLDSVGINIPFISDLLKPEVQDAGNLKIYTSDINNKFVENSKIGKLLVITGKAKNGYSDARSYISITGKLYAKGNMLSKTVYCGTILSEPDLLNMDLDAINNRLSNRFGDNKSNVRVKADAIIPFMIVFANLPENLDEFTIEVDRSFPS